MTKPLVSIVLPTFNRASLLNRAIEKSLEQTYDDIELLVVDDGSSDNTKEIVLDWSKRDERVRYLRKPHSGVPGTLNFGFTHARGTLFTWTSDDNEYYPNALEEMVNAALPWGPCLLYCDQARTYVDGETKIISFPLTEPLPALLRRLNPVGNCFLYHRSIAEAIGGYDKAYYMAEDYEYWIRISRQFPVVHLPKVLYYCHYYGPSLTNSRRSEVRTAASLIRLRHGLISPSVCLNEIKSHLQYLLASDTPTSLKVSSFTRIIRRTAWLFITQPRDKFVCHSDGVELDNKAAIQN